MTEWYDTHKGRPEEHTDKCYCGRKATRHVIWLFGCGNVCGIHARSIISRSPSGRTETLKDVA